MPRTLKTDKFFMYNAKKSGYWKNKILLGVNHVYVKGNKDVSLQDLFDFLKEKNIDPLRVKLNDSFSIIVEA